MKNQFVFVVIFLFLLQCKVAAQNGIDSIGFQSEIKKIDVENALIVIGEAHDVAGTYQVESFIINQLHRKGYNRILIEGGVSEACLLNRYLETGNEEYLNYTRAKGMYYREFVKSIAALQDSGAIEFVGFDFERGICMEYLFADWVQRMDAPELTEFKNRLKGISAKTSPKQVKQCMLWLQAIYDDKASCLKMALGADEETLKRIVFNPVYESDFILSNRTRDAQILEHLSMQGDKLSNSIMIVGSNHLTNANCLGSDINTNTGKSIKVHFFVFTYSNCENLLKRGKVYSSAEPIGKYAATTTADIAILFEYRVDEILNNENSIHKFMLVKLLNQ